MRYFISVAAVLALCGCSFQAAGLAPASQPGTSARRATAGKSIDHVVIIVQENRSFDNLFNGFPNADTVTKGLNSKGEWVTLEPVDLAAKYDLSHKHGAWLTEYADGAMDGFDQEKDTCFYRKVSNCPAADAAAYAYVPKTEVQPYWDLAQQYTIADEMFETSQGPSFAAHQYLISGTSAISNSSDLKASENAGDESDVGHQGGCDSLPSTTVATIDPFGSEGSPVFPCFDRISIFDELDADSVSWRYYQAFGGPGQWHAPDAIRQIWESRTYKKNVVYPSSKILSDVANGRLADVVFVTPTAAESDHPGQTNGTGPSWVGDVVNAIGKSKYWNSTAIILVWDDWGGWYDHVKPEIYNSFEDGFRVPMVVISPYAKSGYVSHVNYDFGSILKFVEETFGLPSLGTTDERAKDLSDCFSYAARPRAFTPIRTRLSAQYFLHQPIDYRSPDTDF